MYTIRQHHGHDHELAATDAPGNVVGIILNDLPQFDIKMPFGNKKKLDPPDAAAASWRWS